MALPLGVLAAVTGVSGSGKSTLISQVLIALVADALGQEVPQEEAVAEELESPATPLSTFEGRITSGMSHIKRLVQVDQRPIGRTPRSNSATYTGLFDQVRQLFAATKAA